MFISAFSHSHSLNRQPSARTGALRLVYLDAPADGDRGRLPGGGGDGDGAHLVVKAIVVSVIHNKVEEIRDRLASRLQGSDVAVGEEITFQI